MVQTIGPLGEWHNRGTYLWLSAGLVLAASAVGYAAGTLGKAVPFENSAWVILLVTSAFAAGWLVHRRYVRILPALYWRRQVNARYTAIFGRRAGHLLFGLVLGVGPLTYVGRSHWVVPMAGAVMVADPGWSAFVMVWYGAGRALAILALSEMAKSDSSLRAIPRLGRIASPLQPGSLAYVVLMTAVVVVLAAAPQWA